MLKHLSIKNYALIESLEIEFDRGLNILTGETGSGKSIILGALGLLIGDRAETRVVQDGMAKCIVEGSFDLTNKSLESVFDKYDIDFEEITLIRREILSSGKSRAFINDTPVKLNVLKDIGMRLLDIHSQHQTIQINDPKFQLSVVDRNAQTAEELKSYQECFQQWKTTRRDLEIARKAATESRNESDFIRFQLNELREANLDTMDAESIEEEYNTLAHAEDITRALSESAGFLSEQENAVLQSIKESKERIDRIAHLAKGYSVIAQRLQSVYIEIDDIVQEIEQMRDGVEADPMQLELLEEKRSIIFRLEKKHVVNGVQELIEKRNELQARLDETDNLEERIAKLENKALTEFQNLAEAGKKLSDKRRKTLDSFSKEIQSVLKVLNMKAARFEIDLIPLEDPSERGFDAIEMRFSANAGRKPEPLKYVASGGELSRLMLAIKNISANSTERKTILFDEIDTGVSGEVANAMGTIMKEMALDLQVICITHLPQIASKGTAHFKVYKRKTSGKENTHIERLNPEERVVEIAQMLSGASTTQAALQNAKDLLLEN